MELYKQLGGLCDLCQAEQRIGSSLVGLDIRGDAIRTVQEDIVLVFAVFQENFVAVPVSGVIIHLAGVVPVQHQEISLIRPESGAAHSFRAGENHIPGFIRIPAEQRVRAVGRNNHLGIGCLRQHLVSDIYILVFRFQIGQFGSFFRSGQCRAAKQRKSEKHCSQSLHLFSLLSVQFPK